MTTALLMMYVLLRRSALPDTDWLSRYGNQFVVPRNASKAVEANVVVDELSMKSRNGGLTDPRRKSGISHHNVPSATKTGQKIISSRRLRPGAARISHTTPSGMTANVAAAFTPPTQVTAIALSAAM